MDSEHPPFLIEDRQWLPFTQLPISLKIAQFSVADYDDQLFQQQEIDFPASLKMAVDKRRAEYLAGRILAKRLLLAPAVGDWHVGFDHHRCPLWPNGIVGSISHSNRIATCAIAKSTQVSGIGIDIEQRVGRDSFMAIRQLAFIPEEWQRLTESHISPYLAATIGFSAKESLFKALYPSVGRYFDFSDAHISHFDANNRILEMVLSSSLGAGFPIGRKFIAQFSVQEPMVMTIVITAAIATAITAVA